MSSLTEDKHKQPYSASAAKLSSDHLSGVDTRQFIVTILNSYEVNILGGGSGPIGQIVKRIFENDQRVCICIVCNYKCKSKGLDTVALKGDCFSFLGVKVGRHSAISSTICQRVYNTL